MKAAISLHSIVPLRSEASEKAEQLTQMLFNETCEVLDYVPHWYQIRLHTDQQVGWVDEKMITLLTETEYERVKANQHAFTAIVSMPMAYAVSEGNGQTIPLTAGTKLYGYHDGFFSVLGANFRIDPQMVIVHPLRLTMENMQGVIRFFLNIPYQWGGKNAMGMDCSGFIQIVASLFGHSLPRNASEQAEHGKPIISLTLAQMGDLVFFDHADQDPMATNISHVGLLLDRERVIHCSGRVKVERIDEQGIFSQEASDEEHPNGQYTHHLVSVCRYF